MFLLFGKLRAIKIYSPKSRDKTLNILERKELLR